MGEHLGCACRLAADHGAHRFRWERRDRVQRVLGRLPGSEVVHEEDVCWSAFRVFDRNVDGKISKEELRQVLHDSSVQEVAGTAAASIEVLMNDVDRNGDGEIDFQEFFAMMKEKN